MVNIDSETSECICNEGYEQDKEASDLTDTFICKDKNECLDGNSCSGVGQKCVNELGGFKCVCETGYQKNPDPNLDDCILSVLVTWLKTPLF